MIIEFPPFTIIDELEFEFTTIPHMFKVSCWSEVIGEWYSVEIINQNSKA